MAKKQKIKNEEPSINFRLPEALKSQIYEQASILNKTVSNFLRDHLSEYMDGALYAQEIAAYKSDAFINSTEFLQLVVWIYKKRNNNKHKIKDAFKQDEYISTIKSLGDQLPWELVGEFDKVLLDLMKVKNEGAGNKGYTFCKSGNSYENGFNYSLLETYILKTEFERFVVKA